MTEQWFGASWGAPCCDPHDHVATPVGELCMHCREPIIEGSQGLIHSVVHAVEEGKVVWSREPTHVDCYLRTIQQHGPECPHCRGAGAQIDHDRECAYRVSGGNCTCIPMPEGR